MEHSIIEIDYRSKDIEKLSPYQKYQRARAMKNGTMSHTVRNCTNQVKIAKSKKVMNYEKEQRKGLSDQIQKKSVQNGNVPWTVP